MQYPTHTIIIKPYSISELAAIYNVSPYVMNKWLAALKPYTGERNGRYFTVSQVVQVFKRMGVPGVTTGMHINHL